MAYQLKDTLERRKKFLLVGPIRAGKTVFAIKSGSDIQFERLEDLKFYLIGQILGYAYADEYDAANFLRKDDGAKNYQQLLRKLALGRVDLIIGDMNAIRYEAKKSCMSDEVKILPKVLKVNERYVGFHKARVEEAELFTKGLNEIRRNGEYEKILKRWE